MERITEKQLQGMVDRLNRLAGTPLTPYLRVDGKSVPQAKCYHLDGAYGGVALHQMCDDGTGVHDIFGGHMPKRELYYRIHAFISGLEAAK